MKNKYKSKKFSYFILLGVIATIFVFCNIVSFNTIVKSMNVINKSRNTSINHENLNNYNVITKLGYLDLSNNKYDFVSRLGKFEFLEEETQEENLEKVEINETIQDKKEEIVEEKKVENKRTEKVISEEKVQEPVKETKDEVKTEVVSEKVEEPKVTEVITNTVPSENTEIYTDDTINAILTNYNLSLEDFYTLVAIVAAEGGSTYEDSYAVINTIYNRARCSRWVNSVNRSGKDGRNLLAQATAPGQFTVYASGSYLRHMYKTDIYAYSAVVNFLTTKELIHNYLSFRSASSNVAGVQFVAGGNIYFGELLETEMLS